MMMFHVKHRRYLADTALVPSEARRSTGGAVQKIIERAAVENRHQPG
jgi:hypothetical protein